MPTLTTRRLSLRLVRASDAEAIFIAYASNASVTKFLTWRPHLSPVTVKKDIQRFMLKSYREGECFPWVITGRKDNRIMGMIDLKLSQKDGQKHAAEIGYVLAEPEWGKGYMTEALGEVLNFALTELKLKRIAAYCDLANKASAKVMMKAGMKREGTMHRYIVHPNIAPTPRDCFCFAIWKT